MLPTLLIWEEVPETTKWVILNPETDSKLINLARQSAGKFINAEENDAINELNELIYKELGDGIDNQLGLDADISKPIPGPFAEVIICGFVL